MNRRNAPPARRLARFLEASEASPANADGDLTATHGFLPRRLRLEPLPELYRPWEEAARSLPSLTLDSRVRAVLGALPPLPAGPDALPDEHLKRAATLLGMIAHSYWRFGIDRMVVARNRDIDAELPSVIADPWAKVCVRLGRAGPGLTTEDWVFNNFTFVDAAQTDGVGGYEVRHIVNEAVRPIVPAYGNQAERVFTACFVDIHAAMAPVVAAACRIEAAIEEAGPAGAARVAVELEEIARCTRETVQRFRRVSPCPSSRTYCDPVDWAKTLVTWTVPPPGYPSGPSGSAAPFMHFLDALIGRDAFDSAQGCFAQHLRAVQLPPRHRVFFDHLRALDVRGYVGDLARAGVSGGGTAVEAFHAVIDAFAGPAGFLGVHKGKVVDYLGVGTVVGRNQSTAHEQTYVADATWTGMAVRLEDAIEEREIRRLPSTKCPARIAGTSEQPAS